MTPHSQLQVGCDGLPWGDRNGLPQTAHGFFFGRRQAPHIRRSDGAERGVVSIGFPQRVQGTGGIPQDSMRRHGWHTICSAFHGRLQTGPPQREHVSLRPFLRHAARAASEHGSHGVSPALRWRR
jgi:hypothetical protein